MRSRIGSGRLIPVFAGLAGLGWFWFAILLGAAARSGQLGAPVPAPAPWPL